jgi:hypothetical protein
VRQLAIFLAVISLTGCAAVWEEVKRDPRDAPWDPKQPNEMFTQIPAWRGAANEVCCGWRSDCAEKKLSRRC